ncbi:MAG: hypothetical protein IKU40_06440 [Clostridia bacterium]|nr:hypothetical protein [Clostridia bacterium]
MKIRLEKDWTVAGSWPFTVMQGASVETGAKFTAVTPVIPAKVPGSVYDDLLCAGLIEDPYYERNSLLCEWVANRFWSYQNTFEVSPDIRGKRVRLVLKGIDYHAHIYLNDRKIAEHTGMYVPCVTDITDALKYGEANTLTVVLENAPDEMGQIGYTSRTFTQKARFGYKWDFGTRLVNLGLYDEVYLDVCSDPLKDVHIRYIGDGTLKITAENPEFTGTLSYNGWVCAMGPAQDGKLLLHDPMPKLWYPNGYGEQPLYDLKLTTDDDEKTYRVGFRTVEYRQPKCADRTVLPYIPVINGREIYIKGVNMTPLDHMYGCVTRERYEQFIKMAAQAHVNLIRVWGGGIIEKEDFYDLCDRYGIMVWQEFIQSSSGIDNIPSKRPEFLALCEATARAAVTEKRNHVSLTYWSGGNELMDEHGIPSTFDDPNIAMLREIVRELSPEILMLPTSASGPTEWFDPAHPERNQDIHGPWKYEGTEGHYNLYNSSTILLHSEFGVDGMSNLPAIESVLAPENRKVTTMGENLTWRHHGEWWDTYVYRERPLFGELSDLGELVKLSQFMQAEGIRYAIESHRRRSKTAHPWSLDGDNVCVWPRQENIGAIVWQFNEPWPCVSCTCMVDYYGEPKLAYDFFREAQTPLHVSMQYDKLLWKPGEWFLASIYVHDDPGTGAESVTIRVYGDDGAPIEHEERTQGINFIVPEGRSFRVECELTGTDGSTDRNVYLFLIADGEGKADKTPVLDFFDEYRK